MTKSNTEITRNFFDGLGNIFFIFVQPPTDSARDEFKRFSCDCIPQSCNRTRKTAESLIQFFKRRFCIYSDICNVFPDALNVFTDIVVINAVKAL